MYLTLLANGKIFYTDYNKELEQIFKSGIIGVGCTNGKSKGDYLKFKIITDSGYITEYFYRIVYCFYYRGLTIKNIDKVLRKFTAEMKGKSIDHLDDNPDNNCISNLSIMTDAENKSKPNTKKYFKHLFRLDKAYNGTHYIVRFMYIYKKELRAVYYTCGTPQKLIDTLKRIRADKWQIRANKSGTIFKDKSIYIGGKYPFVETIQSNLSDADIQRKLLNDK